jgi:hypothetical protein
MFIKVNLTVAESLLLITHSGTILLFQHPRKKLLLQVILSDDETEKVSSENDQCFSVYIIV